MVRKALKEDLIPVALMSEEFFIESNYLNELGLTFDDASYVKYLMVCMVDDDTFFYVSEKEGKPIGFLIGNLICPQFNRNEKIAIEAYFYMKPQERNGLESRRLVKTFENWANYHNAKLIEIGCVKSMKMDKVSKLYQKLGYSLFSMGHVKKAVA